MAKNAKEQDNEVFFVQVRDPAEVRRDILESLKDILELLQRFEKFKQKRHEKLQRILHLRKLVKDAHKLMGNMKLRLPQTNLRGVAPSEAPKPVKKAAKKKEAKEVPKKEPRKEKTELERLEEELSAIESKLKSFT